MRTFPITRIRNLAGYGVVSLRTAPSWSSRSRLTEDTTQIFCPWWGVVPSSPRLNWQTAQLSKRRTQHYTWRKNKWHRWITLVVVFPLRLRTMAIPLCDLWYSVSRSTVRELSEHRSNDDDNDCLTMFLACITRAEHLLRIKIDVFTLILPKKSSLAEQS